jgi:hypothetical protein
MIAMRFLPKLGRCRSTDAGPGVAGETKDADVPSESEDEESNLLKTVGWVSAALGAVAIGLLVGRELRLRYKFNRRTPYDLYAHSGDELPDVDCGVGI